MPLKATVAWQAPHAIRIAPHNNGRLAWRRWPPPCSPEWHVAAGAHAQALAWAEEHAPRFIF